MGSFTFFSFLLLHYLYVHVTAQNPGIQAVPDTAKAPGTFSNGVDGLLNSEPPDTDDEVPSVYGVRTIDLPFFRLYHGNINYFKAGELNTPTGDADVWGSQYDHANQSACGIPDNAYWISKVAIHPYFLKFADLSRYCMQDVCISFWKEDGSQDMMLKVTDICSTDPNDPSHCASPADIKIDRTKASIMESAALNSPAITGNAYPDKVWWFFTKCWDDGLPQPAYKGNNWFSNPVIPNNLNWSQSTADRQYQLNQISYPQHGFETYPNGGYNTERDSVTSPPITDWVPGQEPSWEPIAGGVGWGKQDAPKAAAKDVSTKAPAASKAPDKTTSTKAPAASKAPAKDVSSKTSDSAHTTHTKSSSLVDKSSAVKATDHTATKVDHDASKSDSKAAATTGSDSASKTLHAASTTQHKSHSHSSSHNGTTHHSGSVHHTAHHNGTIHHNSTRTGSHTHSRTRKPCSITSTPGADSKPSAKEAPVPYASSTTSAGSPPSAPSGAGSAPSAAQQNGGSAPSAANGADLGSNDASSSTSSSPSSSTSSDAGSAPDASSPSSTPPTCASPVTVTLTNVITVTVTPSPTSSPDSGAGLYPSSSSSTASEGPDSSAGSAASSAGGVPVSTATVLPLPYSTGSVYSTGFPVPPSNGSYHFAPLSSSYSSASSTTSDTSSAKSHAGSHTKPDHTSSPTATPPPTTPPALPDSASATSTTTTTPCAKPGTVKRRHEHVERHQRKARRGGHRK